MVLDADELVAHLGIGISKPTQSTSAMVDALAYHILTSQHLVSEQHLLFEVIVLREGIDQTIRLVHSTDILAVPNVSREPQNRRIESLAMYLSEHHIRLALGEETCALRRRQLSWVSEHQHWNLEAENVLAHLLVHHRALIEFHQLRSDEWRVLGVQLELRLWTLRVLDQMVDATVDGTGSFPGSLLQPHRSLPGEGATHYAPRFRGNFTLEEFCQCRLPTSSESAEIEERFLIRVPVVEPLDCSLQCCFLLLRQLHWSPPFVLDDGQFVRLLQFRLS